MRRYARFISSEEALFCTGLIGDETTQRGQLRGWLKLMSEA